MQLTLDLGKTMSGQRVAFQNGDNPHIYATGHSGSGKSSFLRKMVGQAVRQDMLCVVFDYTGDFRGCMSLEGIPIERVDVTSTAFTMNPLVSVDGQSPDMCAQQLLCQLHSIFRMGSRATMALRSVAKKYLIQKGVPTVNGLLEYASGLKKSGTGLAAALDPLTLLASQIHSGDTPISLDLSSPKLVVLDFGQIIDVDLKKFVIELILQAIWTQRTIEPFSCEPPLVLVMDEAQN